MYVAIVGKVLDGHRFVSEAIRKGASGVIVAERRGRTGVRLDGCQRAFVVSVQNTTRALGDIAVWHRQRFSPRVVGIVGSNGKSTTKEMLASILGQRLRVLKPASSYNNDIGVPLTVLQLDRRTEAAIVEMEMNEIGGTRRLCEIARPQIGIVTNIGDTHLEFLRDRRGVAAERSELVEYIGAGGTSVLNADDPLVMKIGDKFPTRNTITFGISRRADVYAVDIRDSALAGVSFLLNGEIPVHLQIPGVHNVYNALAAIAGAGAVGLKTCEAIAGIQQFRGMPMRLQVERLREMTLIVDCYNANPQSMAAALKVLAGAGAGRKIAIVGDMFELGPGARKAHRILGQRVARVADAVVARGRFAPDVVAGARKAGLARDCATALLTNREVSHKLIDTLRVGDTILIKGSRANLLEEVVRDLRDRYGEKQTSASAGSN